MPSENGNFEYCFLPFRLSERPNGNFGTLFCYFPREWQFRVLFFAISAMEVPQMTLQGTSAISRRYTSGAKSAWEADFHPDVTRQENREVPQRGLQGTLGIS